MENVTLTAHVASASARFDEARKRRVGYELSLVLQGMWPVSCVNPSVLQNTALRRWHRQHGSRAQQLRLRERFRTAVHRLAFPTTTSSCCPKLVTS